MVKKKKSKASITKFVKHLQELVAGIEGDQIKMVACVYEKDNQVISLWNNEDDFFKLLGMIEGLKENLNQSVL